MSLACRREAWAGYVNPLETKKESIGTNKAIKNDFSVKITKEVSVERSMRAGELSRAQTVQNIYQTARNIKSNILLVNTSYNYKSESCLENV